MKTSIYKNKGHSQRLVKDVLNIPIFTFDDIEPAPPSTYDGKINMPTLKQIANHYF